MDSINNASLGAVFLLVAGAATFVMFYLWAFPYHHATRQTAAPKSLVLFHRLLGYTFVAIYVYMMIQMVPRMWTYQIELPARTVAHLVIGLTIGAILLTKMLVVRFFKHMEAKLAPVLGTALFICTIVLMGLALPFVFREYLLRSAAMSGQTFSAEQLERVRSHLPDAGLDDQQLLAKLASAEGLMAGRRVLMRKCTQCHDLRTVLVRPRTAAAWRDTVRRMANRSTVLQPINDDEQWQVTAYLVAISPTLQQTFKQRRSVDLIAARAQTAMQKAYEMVDREEFAQISRYDPTAAKALFETRCSQCHAITQVDENPPRTNAEVSALVSRMVQNGLSATEDELAQVILYLRATYVSNPAPAAASRPIPGAMQAESGFVVRPMGDEMRFAQTELTMTAGTTVTLAIDNTSTSMPHNVTVLRSRADIDSVLTEAMHAVDRGFAPDHPSIVASTGTADPGTRKAVTFTVPAPGNYPYLCLVPGHGVTMRGVLRSLASDEASDHRSLRKPP